jgi:hypothetical protein
LSDDAHYLGEIVSMARRVSAFIAAISLAGCVERTAPPPMAIEPVPAQTTGQLTALVKPQFEAWIDCALAAASKYFSADESAGTVARAAMTACHARERDYENALAVNNRTRLIPAEGVSIARNTVTEKLTQMIIERRQDIKLAKTYSEEWASCVIDAAAEIAKRDLSVKEAVVQSYRVCGAQEEAVRRQLATLTSDPAAEIERRKTRVAPVVAKFVEEVRSGGPDRPKRPDITI